MALWSWHYASAPRRVSQLRAGFKPCARTRRENGRPLCSPSLREAGMNARSLTIPAAVLLLSGAAWAGAPTVDGVYVGKLGKQDIVIEFGPIESLAEDKPYD